MRKSLPALMVCALWIVLGAAYAQEKQKPGAAQADDAQSVEANNRATKQKLSTRLEVELLDMSLADVLRFVEEKLDIEVFAQRQEIEATGVPLDAPVTLHLKRVRGDMLLDLVLRQVSPELGYVVRDGIVIVSGKASLSDHLAIRVYNCRDLLAMSTARPAVPGGEGAAAPGAGSAPGGSPPGAASGGAPGFPGGYGGGGIGGPGGFGGGFGVESLRSPEVEQLVRLLQTTVAPDTWDVNGGPGTLEEFGGMLVVNQTEEVHDRIEKLLGMLREAAEKEPGGK